MYVDSKEQTIVRGTWWVRNSGIGSKEWIWMFVYITGWWQAPRTASVSASVCSWEMILTKFLFNSTDDCLAIVESPLPLEVLSTCSVNTPALPNNQFCRSRFSCHSRRWNILFSLHYARTSCRSTSSLSHPWHSKRNSQRYRSSTACRINMAKVAELLWSRRRGCHREWPCTPHRFTTTICAHLTPLIY